MPASVGVGEYGEYGDCTMYETKIWPASPQAGQQAVRQSFKFQVGHLHRRALQYSAATEEKYVVQRPAGE